MLLLVDDDDVFFDAVYWAMIEGKDFDGAPLCYIARGSSREVAIKGAVDLWVEKHPHRIPERLSAKIDKPDKTVDYR